MRARSFRPVRRVSASGRARRRHKAACVVVVGVVVLSGCGTGTLATPDTSSATSSASSAAGPAVTGPTIVVTVPDLVTAGASSAAPESPAAVVVSSEPSAVEEGSPSSVSEATQPADAASTAPPAATSRAAAAPQPAPPAPTTTPPPAAPVGAGLTVSLANCDGCTVLATHRDVTGDRSAALVGTGSRAILLSVAADGATIGAIGVPYGAAFAEPEGGVLGCAQGRCVVQGRQPDGTAILSAFELTDTGAWRDVSGDDAFPSATEQAAVLNIDGALALAVQNQGDGRTVWLLYTWNGDRYVVVGCSADGSAPTSVAAVSPDQCLS